MFRDNNHCVFCEHFGYFVRNRYWHYEMPCEVLKHTVPMDGSCEHFLLNTILARERRFCTVRERRATKSYICDCCGAKIHAGEQYHILPSRWKGDPMQRMHPNCTVLFMLLYAPYKDYRVLPWKDDGAHPSPYFAGFDQSAFWEVMENYANNILAGYPAKWKARWDNLSIQEKVMLALRHWRKTNDIWQLWQRFKIPTLYSWSGKANS